MFKGIEINGVNYLDNSKCPCCSSERDVGGRLKLKKRTREFLKCEKCKYTILSKKTRDKIENYFIAKDKKRVK